MFLNGNQRKAIFFWVSRHITGSFKYHHIHLFYIENIKELKTIITIIIRMNKEGHNLSLTYSQFWILQKIYLISNLIWIKAWVKEGPFNVIAVFGNTGDRLWYKDNKNFVLKSHILLRSILFIDDTEQYVSTILSTLLSLPPFFREEKEAKNKEKGYKI